MAVRFYLAEAPTGTFSIPVNPELGWPEHHEGCWLTFEQAHDRLGPRLRPIFQWAHSTVAAGDDE